jgi:hypothetical protein
VTPVENGFFKLSLLRGIIEIAIEGETINPEQFHITRLMEDLVSFHTSEPRDKVYALLALAELHNGKRLPIKADYTVPLAKCYANFIKEVINDTKDLRFSKSVHDMLAKKIEDLLP